MKAVCTAAAVLLMLSHLTAPCQAAKPKVDENVRKHEIFLSQIIKTAGGIASALEMVKDEKSARRAARRIDQNLDKLQQLKNGESRLPPISREDHTRLYKKYSPKLDVALNRMNKAAHQAGKNSGGEKTFVRSLNRMIKVGDELQRSSGYLPDSGHSVTGPKSPKRKMRKTDRKRKKLKINRFGR